MMKSFKTDWKANLKNPQTIMALFTYRFGNWVYYRVKSGLIRKPLWLLYRIMDVLLFELLPVESFMQRHKLVMHFIYRMG